LYISRDPREIAVSAFHFLTNIPWQAPYLRKHGINEDINKFAQHFFRGNLWLGNFWEYTKQWEEFSEANPNLKILFLQFEDVIKNKAKELERIIKFLGLEDINIDEIVEKTSIEKAREQRKAVYEKSGREFTEGKLFRAGKTASWKECLTPETLKVYEQNKPN